MGSVAQVPSSISLQKLQIYLLKLSHYFRTLCISIGSLSLPRFFFPNIFREELAVEESFLTALQPETHIFFSVVYLTFYSSFLQTPI